VTAAARKAWGIQREDEKKARIDHIHHAVDACVIAALDVKAFTDICKQLGKDETFTRWNTVVSEPYPDFAQRVNDATESILVRHLPVNRQIKPIGKRRQRVPLSVVKRLKQIHAAPAKARKTSAIRGSLHNDTIYGKIKLNGEEVVVLRKTITAAGTDLKKWVTQGNVVDKGVCDALRAQIAVYEAQAVTEKDLANQLYEMPSGIPIKKIRIKVTKPKNPDPIRQQAFDLNKPVYGTGSDILGFNVYKDAKGKLVAEQISLLEEAKHLGEEKSTVDKYFSIYPMQLAFAYEKSPDELKTLSSRELTKRLYVVRQVEEGQVTFYYHREARRATLLAEELQQIGKSKKGESKLNFIIPERKLRVSKGVFLEHMLYEGVHFTLSMDGVIEWLND
jgi:CRISPR-associated endonuclease Csn1